MTNQVSSGNDEVIITGDGSADLEQGFILTQVTYHKV